MKPKLIRLASSLLFLSIVSTSLATRADELENALRSLEKRDAFSGTVLLAQGDNILFSTAVGEASRRYGIKNKIDTKFNIGSMNKMFTSVAILQLVQEGKVSLEDPISNFVDASWLAPEISSKVTVAQLLAHSSGLGDFFVDDFWDSSRLKFRDLEDYKPIVSKSVLEFEPGSQRSYSNVGFLLLGVIIESESGMNYDDYILKHICKPAGMEHTACYAIDKPVPNLAMGYYKKEGEKDWTENSMIHSVRGGPAGGGYSTVGDLFRFSRALTNFKLLNKQYTEKLLDPESSLGFEKERTPIGAVAGHSGGFYGVMCKFEVHTKNDFTVVILCNMDEAGIPVLRALHRKIASLNRK